jgi:membrane protein implicated in regulation of membrane protease activity
METLFLACFVFGLLFLLASVAMGFVGGGIGHGGGVHVAGHAGHAAPGAHGMHAPHVGHAAHLGHEAHVPHEGSQQQGLPLLNASSAVGGLTWFGAAGYLLTRLGDWALPAAIIGGLVAGALGWYLVARFLGLVLKGEVEMDPEDYRLEGTVAQVTVPIPAGGTGEILFEKAGVRRSEAARGLSGAAIPRGTEVVISSYARGFATVQPWTEFIDNRVDPYPPTPLSLSQGEGGPLREA